MTVTETALRTDPSTREPATELGRLRAALTAVADCAGRLSVDDLSGGEARRLVESIVEVERRLGYLRTRCAGRVADVGAHVGAGRRPEDWLAGVAGVPLGEARGTLETAARLDTQPEVADAFAEGRVSERQAREIARAVEENPAAAPRLVDAASHKTFRQLRDDAGRAAREGRDGRLELERQHRRRSTGYGRDSDGMGRIESRLEVGAYAEVKSRLRREADAVFRRAHQEGRREGPQQYLADAFVNLMCGRALIDGASGTDDASASPLVDPTTATVPSLFDGDAASLPTPALPPSPAGRGASSSARAEVIFLVDLAVWRSVPGLSGRTVELVGVGNVPMELVERYLDDAFIKAVVTDGTDVRRVAHLGRHVPAELRTALLVRDGFQCSVPGCDSDHNLEIDHNDVDFAAGGALSLDNCNLKCRPHHRQKTNDGYRQTGGPGRWQWRDPTGRVVAQDPDG